MLVNHWENSACDGDGGYAASSCGDIPERSMLVNIVLHVSLSKKAANGCDHVRVLIGYWT